MDTLAEIFWGKNSLSGDPLAALKQEQILSLKVGTKAVIDNEMLKMQWNVK